MTTSSWERGPAADAECYKVEGVKKVGEKIYDKVVFYVRKSDYFVVRVDMYKDGEFHKFLENYDVKEVDGILTPFKMKMELADGQGKTELILKGLKYNSKSMMPLFARKPSGDPDFV
ncbi:MAG: outer membrane lipoprotein-sorting protein [Desulfobacterales bacterium]